MSVDFSVLKNIDFKNTDNLIFLSIIFVLFIIVLSFFFFILVKIIKVISGFFKKIFNTEVKIANFNQKDKGADLEVVVSGLEESKDERTKISKQKMAVGNFIKDFDTKEEKEPEKGDKQKYDEKEEKDIAEGLSKLKSGSSTGESTLESKMPSKSDDQENSPAELKIPTPERSSAINMASNTAVKDNNAVIKNTPPEVKGFEKNAVTTNNGVIKPAGTAITQNKTEPGQPPSYKKPDSVKENIGVQPNHQAPSQKTESPKSTDSSIFGGKEEVSRAKLRQELKGTNAYQASKEVGLNLNAIERAKLEKEVFSQTYGRNISKTDLKYGVKKLNQKLLDAKTPQEHAKIRKEVKFFKKIGGIK